MLRISIAVVVMLIAASASAQTRPTGYVSTFVDFFPNRNDAVELRARVFAEDKLTPSSHITINLAGFAEGLIARRERRRVEDAIVQARDASVTIAGGPFDLLAGYTRVAWGRLDELQPTDVVNPLDVSRFFFEGRSEARLPVALVRGRWFVSDNFTVEGVYVPVFRRGRFDQLDEPTSPFNIAAESQTQLDVCHAIGCPMGPPPLVVREPNVSGKNAQGGVRLSATTGRVDWSVSAFRGFDGFGIYTVGPAAIVRSFPRFTMIGADFETVRGEWGLRGEVAAFVDDVFQDRLSVLSGGSLDAGVGVDRKAGEYRVSGTVLVHHEAYNVPLTPFAGAATSRTDVSVIASIDRTFAREKYNVRFFSVYGATESSGFLRGIATAKLRDDVALEGSIGWFAGSGRDLVGRFNASDFAYVRLKYYF